MRRDSAARTEEKMEKEMRGGEKVEGARLW